MSENKTKVKGEKKKLDRRQFIKTSLATAATAMFTTQITTRKVFGANSRLGVGFIGAGGRSGSHLKAVHWLKTQGNEDIETVAVCDVYRPRMQGRIESFAPDAKGYMDHRELLADSNVDIVSITTPDHIHGYQAIDAIEAGKDVYCEKPVTHWRQFDLTKKLAKVVEKSNQTFQLGTQGMYDSAWHQMRRYVKEGLIGQPILAECGYYRVGDWGERGMPIDDPKIKPGPDLNWEAFLGDSPKRPFDVSRFFRWRMYEDYAGGPVTDLYPHSLSPVIHILGTGMPERVVATGGMLRYQEREVPDSFNMFIEYPEKVTVAVMGTQGNDYAGTGARGAGSKIPVIRGWEGSLTIEENEIVFIPAPPDDVSVKKEKEAQRFAIEHGEDFIEFWRSFLNKCRKGEKDTLSTMELGYQVQTALHMGMLSYREGKQARFDKVKEEIVFS